MTDTLIPGQLPKAEWERIMKDYTHQARAARNEAAAKAKYGPNTARNRGMVERISARAQSYEDIAQLCRDALYTVENPRSPFSVTLADQIEADARSNDALDAALENDPPRTGIDHEFYDDPSFGDTAP